MSVGLTTEMKVVAVALSAKKGTPKEQAPYVWVMRNHGVQGDAHAGEHIRQVSLLSLQSIKRMEKRLGRPIDPGRFAENVVVDAPLQSLKPKDLIGLGEDVVLEVTAIGKECHYGCEIKRQSGYCIMPTEGVFARVVASGRVSPGDRVNVVRSNAISVVVLAGGKSRRFGKDKRFALLPDGRTWLQRAIDLAYEISDDVVVSVSANESGADRDGARYIPDKYPECGPLGGLVTCMEVCKGSVVLAFAVDQTRVVGDLLRILATQLRGIGVCFEENGEIEPFPCALDRVKAYTLLKQAVEDGRLSVKKVMKEIGIDGFPLERVKEIGEPSYLLSNWNSQEDVIESSHSGGVS